MRFHDRARTMRPDSSVMMPLLVLFVSAMNGPSISQAFQTAFGLFTTWGPGLVMWLEVILLNLLAFLYLAPAFRVHISCLKSCEPPQGSIDRAMQHLNRAHRMSILISVLVFLAGALARAILSSPTPERPRFAELPFQLLEAAVSGYFVGILLSLQFERRLYEARMTVVGLGTTVPISYRSLFSRVVTILIAIVLFMAMQAFSLAGGFLGGSGPGSFPAAGARSAFLTAPDMIFHARQYSGLREALYLFIIKLALIGGLFAQVLWQLRYIIERPLATIRERLADLNSPDGRGGSVIGILNNDEFSPVYREINSLILKQRGQLEVSRRRLEEVIESADDPIISFDSAGLIRVFNPAAVEAFACRRDDALGRDIGTFVEGGMAALDPGVETPVAWKDAHGAALTMASHISGGEGEAWRTAILHDMRKQAEIEARLRAARVEAENASRMKSEFLANMSHELRTPLNAILGFTQLIGDDRNLTDGQREKIRVITRSGEHLLSLINDILDISKIEAGRMEVHESVFDLHEFIGDLRDMFSQRCRKKGLSLYVETLEGLPRYVRGDLGKLRQVMINLVGNAVKFTEEGGIGILVGKAGETGSLREGSTPVRFAVRDTGRGIPPDELDLIMRPFVQASTTDHEGGTGLGLAISGRFVTMMGGGLSVKSALGEGSEFSFVLPLAESADAPSAGEGEEVLISVDPDDRIRALIVDDQESNRLVLREMLERAGFLVDEAGDGKEGYERSVALRPALVFMDIKMPLMDGYASVARIKGDPATRDARVFALTASAFSHDEKRIIDAGFDGFLAKPFKVASLHRLIRERGGIALRMSERSATDDDAHEAGSAPPPSRAEWAALHVALRDSILDAAGINDFAQLSALALSMKASAPGLSAALSSAAASYDDAAVDALLDAIGKDS
ncbi:MAG: ATP-binding protein [Rectinemataceae bacterium]